MRSGMKADAVIRISQQEATNIVNRVSTYPRTISVETASALVNCISEDLEMFSPESRQLLIDSINSKTSRGDNVPFDNSDVQTATVANAAVLREKQSMYHIENYLTQAMWKRLCAVHLNREVVYLEIVKLLVNLGLHRPKEPFWGHLVAFIQWATVIPIDNPSGERDTLKALWSEAKFNMAPMCDGPAEYPAMPSTLMETHPTIYFRAYVGNEQPIRPPPGKDIFSLNVLKQATGCRSTKTSGFHDRSMIVQRHHLALETMLVLGKLCQQRLPGELY